MQWGGRTTRKTPPEVDVLLTDSQEQRIVIGIATDLIAALGPYVNGVDPRKREWPVTELWEDVRLLNRGRADAGAGSDKVACGVSHVLVADREAVIIVEYPASSRRFTVCLTVSYGVWRCCATRRMESPLSMARMTCAAVSSRTSYIW